MKRVRDRKRRLNGPEEGARGTAVRILRERFDSGVPLDRQFQRRPFLDLAHQDQLLCRQLVDGVLRNLSLLDAGLSAVTSRPLPRIDDALLWLLRVTVYQLRFLRVPDYAAVNEAVGLCSLLGRSHARSFVNGVLRNYLRVRPEPPEGDSLKALALRYSHPEWLVSRMLDRHGALQTREILRENNALPPSVVWVNPVKTTLEQFCADLEAEEISFQLLDPARNCVQVEARGFVRHRLYRDGHCFFMDSASQRVAMLPKVEECRLVGDLCAAPGGKSFVTAARLSPGACLLCLDVSRRRLREMQRRAAQLSVSNLTLVQADSSAALPFGPDFDLLMADVPCSGLGTIRSNPDIRWFVEEADLARHQARQSRILSLAFSRLKQGGRIVYSTCSTEPEENEQVVEGFLANEPRAELEGDYFRNLPGEGGGEGFFAARIRRR